MIDFLIIFAVALCMFWPVYIIIYFAYYHMILYMWIMVVVGFAWIVALGAYFTEYKK